MQEAANPTLMGIDVIFVATLLAAVATLAVLIAIYAATTVRDPMAKRVKALNERREQLKAGITASTAKQARLGRCRGEGRDRATQSPGFRVRRWPSRGPDRDRR